MSTCFVKPCGLLSKAAWLFLFVVLFVFPATSRSDELLHSTENAYLEGLISEAMGRKLYLDQAWLALLHYKPSFIRGDRSLIDDPSFFLSKKGQYDPQDEMVETLKGFFRTDLSGDNHPRCRFIARYNWLKEELNIKEDLVPGEDCKGFKELMTAVKPESVVLIFPVGHMNSPASMFGHTLLRIDSSYESKLLSYAVNYAALTTDSNGLVFAFKGIFGYYKGFFTILPYYDKIKEYNNLENRDMWEYRLNFTRAEVQRMVEHIWELKNIYSYYYFFGENCSYNLLLVLEAARPGARPTDYLPPWVIPTDTVRAIEKSKMYTIEPAVYRPSKAARIKAIENIMSPEYRPFALDISAGKKDPQKFTADNGIGKEDKARALDLAAEYLQYMYAQEKVDKATYMKSYLRILGARSSLGPAADYPISEPAPPDQGHGPSRFSAGAGVKRGDVYNYLKLRPAYHDLMDPDQGYIFGAAISFLDTEVRYTYPEKKVSLENLILVEIDSIADFGTFNKPVSWRLKAGLEREEFETRRHRTVYGIEAGPGLAYGFSGWLAYAFIEPKIKAGSGLKDGYALGAGASVGVLKAITDAWKVQAQLKATAFEIGDIHTIYSVELNQRFTINANNAIRLDLKRELFGRFYSSDINVSWSGYF